MSIVESVRWGFFTVLAASAVLASASTAMGDAVISSNWAGYAVHRAGVSFHKVSAVWRQPSASCTPGHASYSAFWVGLGGFRPSSRALEQVGTELDCKPAGQVLSAAWFELVPAPSRKIRLSVRPGDVVQASVAVTGHRVTVRFYDATRRRGFQKTLRSSRLDVSSAEWIVEAPSACFSARDCETLPLADFGSASFGLAQAQSTLGHRGTISDPAWGSTVLSLAPGGHRYVDYQGSGPAYGAATPSALMQGGTAFNVDYSKVTVEGSYYGPLTMPRSAYLMHPGR